jgi:hypothetical protein
MKKEVVGKGKRPTMITDSNQACFTKMVGCGFQEEVNIVSYSACGVKSSLLQI